ncbi:MAG: GGDEF domain-containing protein [Pseudomonadota bacterium]
MNAAQSIAHASHDRTTQPTHGLRSFADWLLFWRRAPIRHGVDEYTGLRNQQGFEARGNALLEACLAEGKPLSVVVFDFADLLEVRAIYGNEVARDVLARVVGKLAALAGSSGFAARTGPAEFTVVLPRLGRSKALQRMQRVLGAPVSVEFEAGDSEIVLVPDFLIETADAATFNVAELQHELRVELARTQQREQRRHHYMRRERERHSRPMSLGMLSRTASVA